MLKVIVVSASADNAELVDDAEVAEDWHPTRRLMASSNAEKPIHIHLSCEIDFMASSHEMKP